MLTNGQKWCIIYFVLKNYLDMKNLIPWGIVAIIAASGFILPQFIPFEQGGVFIIIAILLLEVAAFFRVLKHLYR